MTQFKGSIKLGTSFHKIGNTAIFDTSFFKKLENCSSPKTEELVSEFQSSSGLSFGFLGP